MAFRFSITSKVIVLVAIPFVFELVFAGLLWDALDHADRELKKAEHAREISDNTNALIRGLYEVVTELSLDNLLRSGRIDTFDVRRAPQVLKVQKIIDRLTKLSAENPHEAEVVRNVSVSLEGAINAFDEGVKAYRRNDAKTYSYQKKVGVRSYIPKLLNQELIDLPKDAKERQDQAVEREAQFREQMKSYLLLLVACSFLITAGVAFSLILGITSRLSQLRDNTLKMATDGPLPARLSGNDEIADVDGAFHKLVEALSDAHHREKAVLDNALDLICSIDGNGRISAVNKASLDILLYEPDDLMGRYFIDLVAPDDVSHVLKQVDEVKEVEGSCEFESGMVRRDGQRVFVLWSVHWSVSERSLFCVLHDITARKEAERLRQEVISMVTHDLRTPLTAIRMAAEILKSKDSDRKDAGEMLGRISTASTRMMLLINDLLDIEKIRAGSLELSKANLMASDVFEQCNDTVFTLLEEKQIAMEREDGDIEFCADPDRVVQVLVNLVSNAIKFSPRGSQLKLSAVRTTGGVEFSVADQGRGIPEAMLSTVFERFQQVEAADAKLKGGSGLGLAICRSLVQLHGGEIWVESKEGVGSTFKFVIPNPS